MKRQVHLQVLTNSELETFRTCSAKHGFAYDDLLRPIVSGTPLSAGHILHAGIAAGWNAAWSDADVSLDTRLERALAGAIHGIQRSAYEQKQKLKDALRAPGTDDQAARIEAAIQALEIETEAVSWVVPHYFRSVAPDLEFVPLFIEGAFQFPVPIKTGRPSVVQFAGRRDLVLWDRSINRIVVQDHKGTRNNVRSLEKKLPLDTQFSGYVYELKLRLSTPAGRDFLLGEMRSRTATPAGALAVIEAHADEITKARVGAVAFNVLRRKRPAVPKRNLLKKNQAVTEGQKLLFQLQEETKNPMGEVSVAALDTTPQVYADALLEQVSERELPITPKQREFLDRLKAAGDTYFAQLEWFRGDRELERWRTEVLIDARRIRGVKRGDRTRNPGACSLPQSPPCAFASLCANPDGPLVRADYVRVDTPHQELKEDEEYGEPEEAEFGF